jgi:DNA invertase Pin-like site-specific DNA recombinase
MQTGRIRPGGRWRSVYTKADLVYTELMEARSVVGYVRVGPRERRASRPSRTRQREAIEAECSRRGWTLAGFFEDVRSGRSLRRPGLHAAMEACRDGRAAGIVVERLDRLTYSVEDLAYLMQRAVADRFFLVAPDVGLDLTTDRGAHLASVLALAAGWQPRGVGRRAVLALEHRRDGESRGRPSSTPAVLADRIRAMRSAGATLQAICDSLNAEGVPTPRGGTQWRPTSLRAIVRPQAASGPPLTEGARDR